MATALLRADAGLSSPTTTTRRSITTVALRGVVVALLPDGRNARCHAHTARHGEATSSSAARAPANSRRPCSFPFPSPHPPSPPHLQSDDGGGLSPCRVPD